MRNVLFVPKRVPKATFSELDQSIYDDFSSFENVRLPKDTLIYSGSFNPLHEGHVALVAAGVTKQKALGITNNSMVVFELPIVNADKPSLAAAVVWERLRQFRMDNPLFQKYDLKNFAVCVTAEPLFLKKADLFAGCTFLVG